MSDASIEQLPDEILSLAQAAERVPHSETALYRIARQGGDENPFRKVAGRWCTTHADLVAWIRSGAKGTGPRSSPDPVPPVTRGRSTGGALATVRTLRPKGKAA